jgi:hypothetical protein
LLSGFGRSGTTALMALLATDPRVALDRVYPFENRYLTYLAKLAALLDRRPHPLSFDPERLYEFDDCSFAATPWAAPPGPSLAPAGIGGFAALWAHLRARVSRAAPGAGFYAEKVPAWVPALVRSDVPSQTLYLFRDPRDVFLSAAAFLRRRGGRGFGRAAGDGDGDHALGLAHGYLEVFENYRADRSRSDCHLVRYPELVGDAEGLADRLHRLTGVKAAPAAPADHLDAHRTSADPGASVDRWRREPLPPEVGRLLETHLHEAMGYLGFEPSVPGVALPPGVEFSRPGVNVGPRDTSGDGSLHPAGEYGARVELCGEDFWFVPPLPPFRAERVREVWACLAGAAGDHCSLYWHGKRGGFSEGRCLHLPCHRGRHWRVLRFPVGRHPRWRGTVVRLRLDAFNGPGAPEGPLYVRWVRLIERG